MKFSNNKNQRKSDKYDENEETNNSKLLSFSNKSANEIERQMAQWSRVLPVYADDISQVLSTQASLPHSKANNFIESSSLFWIAWTPHTHVSSASSTTTLP